MATTQSGDYRDVSLFYGGAPNNRAHTQALYATSEVGLRTGTIHGLRFRRSSYQSGPAQSTDIFVTIEMSVSPVSPMAPSNDFASNRGPNHVQVFQGLINLTPVPASTAWPAAWEAPIVFQTPFAYDGNAGQSLVVDISVAGNSRVSSWHSSSCTMGYGFGTPVHINTACTTSDGGISGSYGFNQFQPTLGGRFGVSFLGYATKPSYQFSWLLIGFAGPGSPLGNTTLPVSLNSLGFAADPDCRIAVRPDLMESMLFVAGQGGGAPGVIGYSIPQLPSDASWLGTSFFTQAVSLDYDNGTMIEPLIFPSMALRWTFGSGQLPNASRITRIADTAIPQATGTPTIGEAPVFEFDLR